MTKWVLMLEFDSRKDAQATMEHLVEWDDTDHLIGRWRVSEVEEAEADTLLDLVNILLGGQEDRIPPAQAAWEAHCRTCANCVHGVEGCEEGARLLEAAIAESGGDEEEEE